MPTFTANAYLLHEGKVVQPEETLELTNEQAKRHGDKGSIVAGSDAPDGSQEGSKERKDQTVEELKEIAQTDEIEGYSTMKKAELVEAIEARQ